MYAYKRYLIHSPSYTSNTKNCQNISNIFIHVVHMTTYMKHTLMIHTLQSKYTQYIQLSIHRQYVKPLYTSTAGAEDKHNKQGENNKVEERWKAHVTFPFIIPQHLGRRINKASSRVSRQSLSNRGENTFKREATRKELMAERLISFDVAVKEHNARKSVAYKQKICTILWTIIWKKRSSKELTVYIREKITALI